MNDTLKAALWMIGAIASFTSMAVAGREVSFELDTFEIMLFRSMVGICVVLLVSSMVGTRSQIRAARLPLHALRNVAHFTGQNLWFYAVSVLPLAQVFALEFTTPIWALLLAPFILKEKITGIGLLAASIGFVGVMIVTQPGAAPLTAPVFAAAGCAIGFALSALFTRRLTRTESISSILFWLTAMQLVLGLICAGYDGDIALPSMATAPWLVLIALAGLLAHLCLTTALSLAPATVVMPIDFVRLPVVALVAAILYQETVGPWVFVGAMLIFGANYLNISASGRSKPGVTKE